MYSKIKDAEDKGLILPGKACDNFPMSIVELLQLVSCVLTSKFSFYTCLNEIWLKTVH